jgi:predicted small lipoprotein YifL
VKILLLITTVLLAFQLSACGQKGPLFMPKEAQVSPQEAPASQQEAPRSQQTDNNE